MAISEQAREAVREWARKRTDDDHEHGAIIHRETGELLLEVCSMDMEQQLMAMMSGSTPGACIAWIGDEVDGWIKEHVTVHSHPNATSFSPQDYVMYASNGAPAGFVVSRGGNLYGVERPEGGWPGPMQAIPQIQEADKAHGMMATDPLLRPRLFDGKDPVIEQITSQIMEGLARGLGATYTKEEL